MYTKLHESPSLCDRFIRAGFSLLFLLVPLILTPVNYELFEFNKMMVTYAVTVVITSAWIVKMIATRNIAIAKTLLTIPIVLFFVSQLIASVFSMDQHVSWFGYYSRFNGGMLSVVSYILLYYAFVSNIMGSSPVEEIPIKIKNQTVHTKDTRDGTGNITIF